VATTLAVINGIAIVVLVGVTGYYAWQTREMAKEMRSARLLSLLPKLVLDIGMIGPTYGDIVVRNVGSGPALDADLTLVFEGSEAAEREEREWLAHVIATGEEHEFLPPREVNSMDGFAARHPTISLAGTIHDALGQAHEVDERIDIAEAWGRVESALHRWEESPATKVAREFEKTRKQLEKIDSRLSVLAELARAEAKKHLGL
jgi:hypothetical protein